MGFNILDASAFYAGIPFRSTEKFYTTPLVFDEIEHIKKNHDALRILIETDRLKIIEPESSHIQKVTEVSKKTGDFQQISKPDISSIALCLQLEGSIITDDFAVSNVSKNLGIKVIPIMTSGIKKVGKWKYFCKACKKEFSNLSDCPVCGSSLTKKLFVKNQNLSK